MTEQDRKYMKKQVKKNKEFFKKWEEFTDGADKGFEFHKMVREDPRMYFVLPNTPEEYINDLIFDQYKFKFYVEHKKDVFLNGKLEEDTQMSQEMYRLMAKDAKEYNDVFDEETFRSIIFHLVVGKAKNNPTEILRLLEIYESVATARYEAMNDLKK